ncbi:MAG: hypothetical protein RMJ43_12330, partial [Chloroherpetonaceae bacterium]|nr:hypothetical protein [Chloroherpetonaceae bacterium]
MAKPVITSFPPRAVVASDGCLLICVCQCVPFVQFGQCGYLHALDGDGMAILRVGVDQDPVHLGGSFGNFKAGRHQGGEAREDGLPVHANDGVNRARHADVGDMHMLRKIFQPLTALWKPLTRHGITLRKKFIKQQAVALQL